MNIELEATQWSDMTSLFFVKQNLSNTGIAVILNQSGAVILVIGPRSTLT